MHIENFCETPKGHMSLGEAYAEYMRKHVFGVVAADLWFDLLLDLIQGFGLIPALMKMSHESLSIAIVFADRVDW